MRCPLGANASTREKTDHTVTGGHDFVYEDRTGRCRLQRHMTIPNEAQLFGALPAQPTIATPALITAMLDSGAGISDLIFSPGRPPQVEQHGELVPVAIPAVPVLTSDDTA